MSIAVIVDTFPRWSERFIARELNELKRRGAALSIYCLKAGDAACNSDPEFSDLIQHRVVLPACFIPSAARELGVDAASMRRRALAEAELGLTAFRQIGCANSLVKLLREQQPSAVYAHFASLPSTLGWLAAETLGLPLLISAHARDVFVEAQVLSEKIRYAQKIFACNEKACSLLEAAQMKTPVEGRIQFMRHGLPLEAFVFKARAIPAADTPLKLLAAGRLVKKKGFGDLIEALALLPEIGAPILLTMLGDGPERKSLETRIAKLGLSARIKLAGSVQGQALKTYFDAADALVVPSIEMDDGDSEGVPNVLLEAFAVGLPVIGTQSGSAGEVLTVETGTVVPQRDPDALAGALSDFASAPERAIEKTRVARALIEARYDIRKNIEPLARALGL